MAHKFKVGDVFHVIADHWKFNFAAQKMNNVGKVERGYVKAVDYLPPEGGACHGRDVITLGDGRVFQRYDCYADFSPYGWEPFKND